MDSQIVSGTSSTQKTVQLKTVQGHWRSLVSRQYLFVLLSLFLVGAFLSLNTDTFLTSNNLFNVARAASWIAIVAFGESMVIIIGGIDLSVGAVMALAGLVTALGLQADLPIPLAILAGLLTGGVAGWTEIFFTCEQPAKARSLI